MVRLSGQLGAAGMLLVAALAVALHAGAGRSVASAAATPTAVPTATPTPTPVAASGELGDATVARPGSERAVSTGGPIGSLVVPEGGFPRCRHMNAEVTAATVRQADTAALCLINKLRRRQHLRALKANRQLRLAAERHARDMVANQYFSHVSQSGRDVSDRVSGAGYLRGYTFWRIGENLAWGSSFKSTAHEIVLAWLNSPAHKHNMFNSRYRQAGLAIAVGAPASNVSGPAGTYATVFGTRRR